MPARTSYDHGHPCWVDLMSVDVDASTAFYTDLFGWDAEDQLDDEGTPIYTMMRIDGKDVCGVGGTPPGAPEMTVWNSYIATDDVDATAEKAAAAGGQILMPPMTVMNSGRMVVFLDPTGAGISAWQAGEHVGAQIANEPNSWSWNELLTGDVDAAKDFYNAVFGWTYEDVAMPMPTGTYTLVAGGENGLAGIMKRPDDVPAEVPDYWGVYFDVEDVDKTLAKAQELGGQVAYAPMDIADVGRMAGILDPQGGVFSVIQPEAA